MHQVCQSLYTAVLDSSLDIKILNGTYKLEEGRHINPDDSCTVLISKELADKNNLSVGDKITFQEFETEKNGKYLYHCRNL